MKFRAAVIAKERAIPRYYLNVYKYRLVSPEIASTCGNIYTYSQTTVQLPIS